MTNRDALNECQALDATDTGIWMWVADRPEGIHVRWPGGDAYLDVRDRIDDESWHRLASQLQQALVTDQPFEASVHLSMEDGQTGEAVFRGARRLDVADRPQVVGLCWLKRAAEQAAKQAQWAPLAKLSHELRSPLAAIVSVLDDVGGATDDAALREALHGARESCAYMSRVIQDMLTGFQSGEAEAFRRPEPLSTDALLHQIVPITAERAARKGLGMDLWRDEAFPDVILVEPDALRRILQNLLDNAVKYTSEGSIALRLDLRTEEDQSRLCFEVVDTGPGMSDEAIGRLFEPFTRGDGERQHAPGLGIGLALCQQLAASLDGRLDVDSTPGEGSRFRLMIPARVTDEADLNTCSSDEQVSVVPQGKRVLIVDDHPLLAKLTGRALIKLGCDIEVAENGLAALTIADRWNPDVVILDLDLPDVSGWEVCRRLSGRTNFANCRFVAYSGSELDHDLEALKRAGFDAYFVKPASAEQLLGV